MVLFTEKISEKGISNFFYFSRISFNALPGFGFLIKLSPIRKLWIPCSLEDKMSSLELIPLSETTITSFGICLASFIAKFLSTSNVVRSLLFIPINFELIDKASFNSSSEWTSIRISKLSSLASCSRGSFHLSLTVLVHYRLFRNI